MVLRVTLRRGVAAVLVLVLAGACLLASARPATAAPVGGSLTLHASSERDGAAMVLAGDTYALARVATVDLTYDEAGAPQLTYAITPAFAAADHDWGTLDAEGWRAAAHELDTLAQEQGLYTDGAAVADANGYASFGWLEGGLYLAARTQVAAGNEGYACDPVLVSVPAWEDGALVYDVVADLKFEWTTPPPAEEEPPAPTPEPENPWTELWGSLTNTGDPAFAVGAGLLLCGVALTYVGWRHRRAGRR